MVAISMIRAQIKAIYLLVSNAASEVKIASTAKERKGRYCGAPRSTSAGVITVSDNG
jgi:hypothetical protein